jgi:Zn-finger nucleic acid-binding protein
MKCPACDRKLTQLQVGDVTLDVCRGGCGGIWFDWFELKKMDEPFEQVGEALDIERDDSVQVNPEQRRHCPHCGDVVMMRHFFSVKRDIEVDECPKCGGFWLDYGELAHIREQYGSESERDEDAREEFAAMFDDELEKMSRESAEKLQKAHRFARLFRFLLPSYYIPGKQRWGAF